MASFKLKCIQLSHPRFAWAIYRQPEFPQTYAHTKVPCSNERRVMLGIRNVNGRDVLVIAACLKELDAMKLCTLLNESDRNVQTRAAQLG